MSGHLGLRKKKKEKERKGEKLVKIMTITKKTCRWLSPTSTYKSQT